MISTISDTKLRICSQPVICFSNTRKNLEAFIVLSVTMFSSSAAKTSSVLRSLKTSRPSLYGTMSKSRSFHVSPIAWSAVSMASSLVAFVDISPINSAWLSSLSSVTLPSVNSSLCGSNCSPTASMSCCQWRSRMAGLRMSVMSGIVRLKASMMSLMEAHVAQALISRPSLITLLPYVIAAVSISSTWRSRNMPPFHPPNASIHSRTMPQMAVRCSSSFSVDTSSRRGGVGMPKIFMPAKRSLSFWRNAATLACASSITAKASSHAVPAVVSLTLYGAASSNSTRCSTTCFDKSSTILLSFSRKLSFALSRSVSVSARIC
mmetsp:Transcript_24020/g.78195  ORF Transcript_24020/g.78195 Transcript_24020/m.78195 type:complete len:320 (+) Transcript_24020:1398-2357(+)